MRTRKSRVADARLNLGVTTNELATNGKQHDEISALKQANLTLRDEISTLKEANLSLQDQISNLKQESSLMEHNLVTKSDQITALEQCSSLLLDIRHRFLSVYKRDNKILPLTQHDDEWVMSGNLEAHCGNAKLDATLYFEDRNDTAVYMSLYGVHPLIVAKICK
jgi:hypothetical protein